jgi:hypothetical protein
MTMSLLILRTFQNPVYVIVMLVVMVGYSVLLMFLDQFLFLTPYFVIYVRPNDIGILVIDIVLSLLTGFVAVVSFREIKSSFGQTKGATRIGLLGMLTALIAGSCPCYYLVPMLTIAGGFGGVLGAAGILLSVYQLPIKLISVLILLLAGYGLEMNARRACILK